MNNLAKLTAPLILAASLQACTMNQGGFDVAGSCSAPSLLAPLACEHTAQADEAFKASDFGLAEKNYRLAADMLEKDAPGSDDHLEALLGLAASYDSLSRFDLADPVYAKLSAYAPNNSAYLNNYGYSLLLRGDVSRARDYFERARKLDPKNPIIMNNGQLAMSPT